MKVVINACACCASFSMYNEPAPLIPLYGVPLIQRTLQSAIEAQLNDFVIVTREEDVAVRQFVDRFAKSQSISITHVTSGQKQNFETALLKEKVAINSGFLYLSCFFIIDPKMLEGFISKVEKKSGLYISTDENHIEKKLDLLEIVRFQAKDGKCIALERGLAEFDGFATGIYYIPKSFVEKLAKQKSPDIEKTLSSSVKTSLAYCVSQEHYFWSFVDSPDALMRTEEEMLASLRKSPHENLIKKWFFRPISSCLSSVLALSKISPECISVIGFIFALLAALFLSQSNYLEIFVGACLALLSFTFHIASEEVSILRNQCQSFSKYFDHILCKYSELALLSAFVLGTVDLDSKNIILIGIFALVGTMMFHFSADRYLEDFQQKHPLENDMLIDPDIRFAVIILGAVFSLPILTLVIFAVLMNAIVIRRLYVWRKDSEKLMTDKNAALGDS